MKALVGIEQDRDIVNKQRKHGKKYAEIVLGETLLIHRYFFRTSYIAYQDIYRVYMRVAGGEFGEFPVDEYSLIVEDREKKEHVLHVDRPEYIKEVIKWLETYKPEIKTGKL